MTQTAYAIEPLSINLTTFSYLGKTPEELTLLAGELQESFWWSGTIYRFGNHWFGFEDYDFNEITNNYIPLGKSNVFFGQLNDIVNGISDSIEIYTLNNLFGQNATYIEPDPREEEFLNGGITYDFYGARISIEVDVLLGNTRADRDAFTILELLDYSQLQAKLASASSAANELETGIEQYPQIVIPELETKTPQHANHDNAESYDENRRIESDFAMQTEDNEHVSGKKSGEITFIELLLRFWSVIPITIGTILWLALPKIRKKARELPSPSFLKEWVYPAFLAIFIVLNACTFILVTVLKIF